MGDYYASQIIKTAVSERAFLDAFKIRLLNWKVAESNELPGAQTAAVKFFSKLKPLFANNSFTLISQAYAQEAPCNPILTKFLSITGAVSKVIPLVGEGVAGAGKLGESYCKGPSADTKLIVSQLNDLKNSVDKVSRTIATLSKFVFQDVINNKTAEFQKLASDARDLEKNYKDFLIRNNSTSLEQYFINAGGWQASLVGQATKSLRMIANASGINATVTQQSFNSAAYASAPVGAQLAGVPKFSANVWGVQDLPLNTPGKTSIGLGVVYVGDRVATTPNVNGLILPSYTTVDAGLFYKIDRVNLALNVKNLTNATVMNTSQGAFVSRQPGTSYLVTAGVNF